MKMKSRKMTVFLIVFFIIVAVITLLPLALLLLLCAHLHLCCRVCIGGVWDSKRYSLSPLLRAKHAAHETAEEICPHNARLPGIRERLVLSLQAQEPQ